MRDMPKDLFTLEALRINSGYSLKQVGKKVGFPSHCIKQWEQDNSKMPIDAIQKISKLYQIKKERIYFGKKKDFHAKMCAEA
jgi:DNA-binding XRE family transcriptional regulator